MNKNRPTFAVLIWVLLTIGGCQDQLESSTEKTEDNIAAQKITKENGEETSNKKNNQQELYQLEPTTQPLTTEDIDAIEALKWVDSANLEKDLLNAVNEKDFRIWIIAGRGTLMPGVEPAKQTVVSQKCGEKYLPGVGDTLGGETHRAYRKKVLEYAKTYNQKMQALCLSVE